MVFVGIIIISESTDVWYLLELLLFQNLLPRGICWNFYYLRIYCRVVFVGIIIISESTDAWCLLELLLFQNLLPRDVCWNYYYFRIYYFACYYIENVFFSSLPPIPSFRSPFVPFTLIKSPHQIPVLSTFQLGDSLQCSDSFLNQLM